MDVPDHGGRDDPVHVVCVDRVLLELQLLDAAAERAQRVEDRAARDVPDVLAVLAEHAAGDAGDADDHVAHEVAGAARRLPSWACAQHALRRPLCLGRVPILHRRRGRIRGLDRRRGAELGSRGAHCGTLRTSSREGTMTDQLEPEPQDGDGGRSSRTTRRIARGWRSSTSASSARAFRAASRRRHSRRLRHAPDDDRRGTEASRLPGNGHERHEVQPLARRHPAATRVAASATRGATPSSPTVLRIPTTRVWGPRRPVASPASAWFKQQNRFVSGAAGRRHRLLRPRRRHTRRARGRRRAAHDQDDRRQHVRVGRRPTVLQRRRRLREDRPADVADLRLRPARSTAPAEGPPAAAPRRPHRRRRHPRW